MTDHPSAGAIAPPSPGDTARPQVAAGAKGALAPLRAATRPHFTTIPFRVADLPVVRMPPRLESNDAPASVSRASSSAEIVIRQVKEGGVRFQQVTQNLKGFSFNSARIAYQTGDGETMDSAVGLDDGLAPCGDGAESFGVLPGRWEGLRTTGPRSAEVAILDAWLDLTSCNAAVVHRTVVSPLELIQGRLYAFRSCSDAACADSSLVLVMPGGRIWTSTAAENDRYYGGTGSNPLSSVVLPLRRGANESMVAMFPRSTSDGAKRGAQRLVLRRSASGGQGAAVPPSATSGALPSYPATLIGVDVVQGARDAEATAIAFTGAIETTQPL